MLNERVEIETEDGVEFLEPSFDHVDFSSIPTITDADTFNAPAVKGFNIREKYFAIYKKDFIAAYFCPADKASLGDIIMKVRNLSFNGKESKKVKNILATMPTDKNNLSAWLEELDIQEQFLDGRYGSPEAISTLFKLSGINWCWAHGNSPAWPTSGIAEVDKHLKLVDSLYGLSDRELSTLFTNYAKALTKSDDPTTLYGVAAAVFSETRNGDFCVFNSMSSQNMSTLGPPTTDYSFGMQQRLGGRILYLYFWCAKYFASKGYDLFKIPMIVTASPQLSMECEVDYQKQDAAKAGISGYLKAANAGFPLVAKSILRKNPKTRKKEWIAPSNYSKRKMALAYAMMYIQGVYPWNTLSWDIDKKHVRYTNALKR